jgi:GTP cyclohydrolase I
MSGGIASHIREVLVGIGEDPGREGLLKTPLRVEKALKAITSGYADDPIRILNEAMFTVDTDEMVIVKDIELYSMCEHHMLPFFGKAHVAYLPAGRVVGLSKLPRLVDMFARRLQVQERLTSQIAKTIEDVIKPRGVGVVIEARHLCMMMRGVGKQNSVAVSSCMLGEFRSNRATRDEFLSLVRSRTNL